MRRRRKRVNIGMWLSYADYPPIPDTMKQMRKAGIRRAVLKNRDGGIINPRFWEALPIAEEAGLEVWTWEYCYGNERELQDMPPRGAVVLDIEGDFNPPSLVDYVAKMDQIRITSKLYVCSFAHVQNLYVLPVLAAHCDGLMPQVFPLYPGAYWDQGVHQSLINTQGDHEAVGIADKLFSPVMEPYTFEHPQVVPPGMMMLCLRSAVDLGYKYVDFFRLGVLGETSLEEVANFA